MNARQILIGLHILHKGDWSAIYKDICNKVIHDYDTLLIGVDCDDYVTLIDQDYPANLKQSFMPPFVLEKSRA